METAVAAAGGAPFCLHNLAFSPCTRQVLLDEGLRTAKLSDFGISHVLTPDAPKVALAKECDSTG